MFMNHTKEPSLPPWAWCHWAAMLHLTMMSAIRYCVKVCSNIQYNVRLRTVQSDTAGYYIRLNVPECSECPPIDFTTVGMFFDPLETCVYYHQKNDRTQRAEAAWWVTTNPPSSPTKRGKRQGPFSPLQDDSALCLKINAKTKERGNIQR